MICIVIKFGSLIFERNLGKIQIRFVDSERLEIVESAIEFTSISEARGRKSGKEIHCVLYAFR